MSYDSYNADGERSITSAIRLENERKTKGNIARDQQLKLKHFKKQKIEEGKSFKTPWGEVVKVKKVLSPHSVVLEGKGGTYSPLQLVSIER